MAKAYWPGQSAVGKCLIGHEQRNRVPNAAQACGTDEISERHAIRSERDAGLDGEPGCERYPKRLADHQSQYDA